MFTNFPTSLPSLSASRGTTGQPLSNPNHITHHTNEDNEILAIATKVGVDGSAVTSTLDYKITNAASIDPGHLHTTAGISGIIAVSHLGSGSPGATNYLRGDGAWTVPPYAQYFKTGNTTHDISVTGTQTIAHGLGLTPKLIRIIALVNVAIASGGATGTGFSESIGNYDGTTNQCIYKTIGVATTNSVNNAASYNGLQGSEILMLNVDVTNDKRAYATATFDGTNITLTWANTGSPTGTANLIWEAVG